MNPRLPPAEPIVATITISVVVILVLDMKNNAKKMSAAIVGPSSITPNDSVRYEFMAHSTIDSTSPATSEREVIASVRVTTREPTRSSLRLPTPGRLSDHRDHASYRSQISEPMSGFVVVSQGISSANPLHLHGFQVAAILLQSAA